MTIEVSPEALIVGAAFLGGQIAILAGVVRSNRDQGRRIGQLEQAERGRMAVAEYKEKRTLSRAHGVPISEDETPT